MFNLAGIRFTDLIDYFTAQLIVLSVAVYGLFEVRMMPPSQFNPDSEPYKTEYDYVASCFERIGIEQ